MTRRRDELVLVEPSRALESEPGFVYHATNEDGLEGIRQKGVLTHRPDHGTDQDAWPDGSTQKRSYWSRNASVVWQFVPEWGRGVIVRTPETPAFRRESTGDIYTTKAVPARAVEVLTTEGWLALDDLEPL